MLNTTDNIIITRSNSLGRFTPRSLATESLATEPSPYPDLEGQPDAGSKAKKLTPMKIAIGVTMALLISLFITFLTLYVRKVNDTNGTSDLELEWNDGYEAGLMKAQVTCALVVADYDNEDGVQTLKTIAEEHKCELVVYKKGANNKCVAGCGYRCHDNAKGTLPNVGREGHTALRYVIDYYDELPDRVLFTPSNNSSGGGEMSYTRFQDVTRWIKKIRRQDNFFSLKRSEGCNGAKTFEKLRNFVNPFYHAKYGGQTQDTNREGEAGTEQQLAGARPLSKWVDKYVGHPGYFDEKKNCRPSMNGHWASTKKRLLDRPLDSYRSMEQELAVGNSPEAGHFVERLTGLIFGGSDFCY